MNKLEYYNRQKEDWSDKELEDLKNEYETKEMTISQIGDIHKRTPGAISYRLKHLNIIENNMLARGYIEYKNSNLYKEIVTTGKKSDTVKKTQKEVKVKDKDKIETRVILTTAKEISDMRNEIESLKKDIKEVLHLIHSIYDFETQENI